jgi:hypothetical protein
MRVFLGFLKTSRAEMLHVFQPTATQKLTNPTTAQEAAQRAADAEFNLITQEEYVILTSEGFQAKQDAGHGCNCNCHSCSGEPTKYARKIHLRQPWEYYGYRTKKDMLDNRENPRNGLTWVKAQFLKRTGISYIDLVTLLKTQYISPHAERQSSDDYGEDQI